MPYRAINLIMNARVRESINNNQAFTIIGKTSYIFGRRRMTMSIIDTSFDFQSDTPLGKDPDAYSPTLKRYHKFLWNKSLPDGSPFDLSDTMPGAYLYHCSKNGEFRLSSDSIIATYSRVKDKKILPVIKEVPQSQVQSFRNIGIQ